MLRLWSFVCFCFKPFNKWIRKLTIKPSMGYISMGTTPQWYFQTEKIYLGWSYVKDLYQIQILKKQWSQQTKFASKLMNFQTNVLLRQWQFKLWLQKEMLFSSFFYCVGVSWFDSNHCETQGKYIETATQFLSQVCKSSVLEVVWDVG